MEQVCIRVLFLCFCYLIYIGCCWASTRVQSGRPRATKLLRDTWYAPTPHHHPHASTWKEPCLFFLTKRYVFDNFLVASVSSGGDSRCFSVLPHLLQLLSQPWRQRLPQPVQQLRELHVVLPVVTGQKRSTIRIHRWIFSSLTLSKAFCFSFFQ